MFIIAFPLEFTGKVPCDIFWRSIIFPESTGCFSVYSQKKLLSFNCLESGVPVYLVYVQGSCALGTALGNVKCKTRVASRVDLEALLLRSRVPSWLHPCLVVHRRHRGKIVIAASVYQLIQGYFTWSSTSLSLIF